MDTYIKNQIVQRSHPHPLGYFGFYFSSILLLVLGFIFPSYWQMIPLGVLLFALGEVLRRATTYYVLDSGVARGYNLFSTSRKFAEYGNVQNIEVSQSFLENILGIGSIKFDTSGSDQIEVHFEGVANPYKIEKIVREKMKSN